jgi:hypothetical protein
MKVKAKVGRQKRRLERVVGRAELRGIRRVLVLLDGYISTQKDQHILLAWDGGLMTWAELREHAKAAIKILTPNAKLSGGVAVRLNDWLGVLTLC